MWRFFKVISLFLPPILGLKLKFIDILNWYYKNIITCEYLVMLNCKILLFNGFLQYTIIDNHLSFKNNILSFFGGPKTWYNFISINYFRSFTSLNLGFKTIDQQLVCICVDHLGKNFFSFFFMNLLDGDILFMQKSLMNNQIISNH